MFRQRLDQPLEKIAIKFTAFDHEVLRQLKPLVLGACPPKFFLVAVSGGVDSVCLVNTLHRLSPILKVPLVVAHVHHGPHQNRRQQKYRDQAQSFARDLAKNLGLPFVTNPMPKNPKASSEAKAREHRYKWLKKWQGHCQKKFKGPGLLVLAQHWDDLLETRLLRLIRGTGPEGLRSMAPLAQDRLRPFLGFSKKEIATQAKRLGLKFCEDPSNQEAAALRNWLRNDWLPLLEQRQKGALRRFALSLALIDDELSQGPQQAIMRRVVPRAEFALSTKAQKRKLLLELLKSNSITSYTTGHLDEAIKRLDTRQKRLKFPMLDLVWNADAEQISVVPVGRSV